MQPLQADQLTFVASQEAIDNRGNRTSLSCLCRGRKRAGTAAAAVYEDGDDDFHTYSDVSFAMYRLFIVLIGLACMSFQSPAVIGMGAHHSGVRW